MQNNNLNYQTQYKYNREQSRFVKKQYTSQNSKKVIEKCNNSNSNNQKETFNFQLNKNSNNSIQNQNQLTKKNNQSIQNKQQSQLPNKGHSNSSKNMKQRKMSTEKKEQTNNFSKKKENVVIRHASRENINQNPANNKLIQIHVDKLYEGKINIDQNRQKNKQQLEKLKVNFQKNHEDVNNLKMKLESLHKQNQKLKQQLEQKKNQICKKLNDNQKMKSDLDYYKKKNKDIEENKKKEIQIYEQKIKSVETKFTSITTSFNKKIEERQNNLNQKYQKQKSLIEQKCKNQINKLNQKHGNQIKYLNNKIKQINDTKKKQQYQSITKTSQQNKCLKDQISNLQKKHLQQIDQAYKIIDNLKNLSSKLYYQHNQLYSILQIVLKQIQQINKNQELQRRLDKQFSLNRFTPICQINNRFKETMQTLNSIKQSQAQNQKNRFNSKMSIAKQQALKKYCIEDVNITKCITQKMQYVARNKDVTFNK